MTLRTLIWQEENADNPEREFGLGTGMDSSAMQEEIRLLQIALRDIAQLVVEDADRSTEKSYEPPTVPVAAQQSTEDTVNANDSDLNVFRPPRSILLRSSSLLRSPRR
jgi:hypothetical protein